VDFDLHASGGPDLDFVHAQGVALQEPTHHFRGGHGLGLGTAVGNRLVGQSLDARFDARKLVGLTQSIASIGNLAWRIFSQSAESLRSRGKAVRSWIGLGLVRQVKRRDFPSQVDPTRTCGAAWPDLTICQRVVGQFPYGQDTELLDYGYRGRFVGAAHLWRCRPREVRLFAWRFK
jgi:hypothetical protein